MVNRGYEPTENEEAVLDVIREETRVNPLLVREKTGLGKGNVNTALSNLRAAGWVRRVTRGLYEFVEDPRETESDPTEPTDPIADPLEVNRDELPVVPGMSFEKQPTDRCLKVVEGWLAYVRDTGKVQRADFEEWYTEEHRDRTGYQSSEFWDFFVEPALRQTSAVEQLDSHTYRWVEEE